MIYYLYGAPASGKTTLGRRLATALGIDFIDLDEAIVRRTHLTIPEIFDEGGEKAFRQLEGKEISRIASEFRDAGKDVVVALGGGSLLCYKNRFTCEKTGVVLCLDTPPEAELSRRLNVDPTSRPLGNKAKARAAHYASFPHRIAAWFDLPDSLVLVGENYAPFFFASCSCVFDKNVFKLYRSTFHLQPPIAILPSGEQHKTLSTIASLWSAFAKKGLGRRDKVVAVGGGVTGDLTGFAAATWMRGIDWINVPTTLLSMVDASTGGKTGCDLPEGKNLAGAFHAPKLVTVDTDFLKTLPPEILRQGKAEMIKHDVISAYGLTHHPPSYSFCPTPAQIARNLDVKVAIVKEDPFERKGKRILLNCGHTIGHAVEKLSNYTLSHGECVAIGCVEEARLAVRCKRAPATWPEELAAHFAAEGLPTCLPAGMTWRKLVPIMRGDKKHIGSSVIFALPCGWGKVRSVPITL